MTRRVAIFKTNEFISNVMNGSVLDLNGDPKTVIYPRLGYKEIYLSRDIGLCPITAQASLEFPDC